VIFVWQDIIVSTVVWENAALCYAIIVVMFLESHRGSAIMACRHLAVFDF